jgi:hypothetical protein
MYLSHTNDYNPNSNEKERYLLAVVLDNDVLDNVKRIRDTCERLILPYQVRYSFVFPSEKVHLLENGFLDEFVKDCKEYQSWEMGCDDPLDYYRFQLHPYEPKEDFWNSLKPDAVTLCYSGDSFGFDAYRDSKMYCGYSFNWCEIT